MGSGSSASTKPTPVLTRHNNQFRERKSLVDIRRQKRKTKQPNRDHDTDRGYFKKLAPRVVNREGSRDDAAIYASRILLDSLKAQDIWKAKYIKERRKVAKLWRSYTDLKYPELSTVRR